MTLRRRLLLWYTGVFAISGCALMLALYLFAAHQMGKEIDKFLRDQSKEWLGLCRDAGSDLSGLEQRIREEMRFKRYFPLTFRLYDPEKKRNIIYIGHTRLESRFPLKSELAGPVGSPAFTTHAAGGGGRAFRLMTMRLGSDTYPGLVLQGGIYIRRLNHRLSLLRLFLGISVLAAVGIALLGGRFLASRSLRPIDDIVLELNRIEAESLSGRLGVPHTRDEVERLRRAINHMLHRLEDSFERIRRFTADAAHEFRSPLASLQCRLEVALNRARSPEEYHEALDDALSETTALARVVNDLLLLARLDARAEQPRAQPVSLKELLAELHEVFDITTREKGLKLTVVCADDCVARGNKELLRRLFGNLIDNAVRYTPSGGAVCVRARLENGDCLVDIEDTGIGIPSALREKIFERFFQADASRSRETGGTGLGLSLCRSIASLHGGSITVQSVPGKGSTFEVRLRAASPPAKRLTSLNPGVMPR